VSLTFEEKTFIFRPADNTFLDTIYRHPVGSEKLLNKYVDFHTPKLVSALISRVSRSDIKRAPRASAHTVRKLVSNSI